MPVGDLDQSKFLDVNYEVDIQIKRGRLSRDMDIKIPLRIGSTNSQEKVQVFGSK